MNQSLSNYTFMNQSLSNYTFMKTSPQASFFVRCISITRLTARIISEIEQLTNQFLSGNPHNQPIDTNWKWLKETLLIVVEKYVRHKIINPYKNLLWINSNVKLLRKYYYQVTITKLMLLFTNQSCVLKFFINFYRG